MRGQRQTGCTITLTLVMFTSDNVLSFHLYLPCGTIEISCVLIMDDVPVHWRMFFCRILRNPFVPAFSKWRCNVGSNGMFLLTISLVYPEARNFSNFINIFYFFFRSYVLLLFLMFHHICSQKWICCVFSLAMSFFWQENNASWTETMSYSQPLSLPVLSLWWILVAVVSSVDIIHFDIWNFFLDNFKPIKATEITFAAGAGWLGGCLLFGFPFAASWNLGNLLL